MQTGGDDIEAVRAKVLVRRTGLANDGGEEQGQQGKTLAISAKCPCKVRNKHGLRSEA